MGWLGYLTGSWVSFVLEQWQGVARGCHCKLKLRSAMCKMQASTKNTVNGGCWMLNWWIADRREMRAKPCGNKSGMHMYFKQSASENQLTNATRSGSCNRRCGRRNSCLTGVT